MEALWTRFLPVFKKVREWINNGEIGDAKMVKADLGFFVSWPKEDRHVNPALGGGGLLDVGIYNIAFSSWVFGHKPQKVTSAAHIGETDVDEQASLILNYSGGEMAVLTSSLSLAGVTMAAALMIILGVMAWQWVGTLPSVQQGTLALAQVAAGMGLVGKGASLFLRDLLLSYGPPFVLLLGIGLALLTGLWVWVFIKRPGRSQANGYSKRNGYA